MVKAIALLSGGLDSALAIKIMQDQGVEVTALNFVSPFCLCNQKGQCGAALVAKALKVPIKMQNKGEAFYEVIRHPEHGYGKHLNPCIDCRIFILRKAKEMMDEGGFDFVFTGEVLGQRPKSQHKQAMDTIEKESGLFGKLLRPLCAKLLPETDVEKSGLVDRDKLLEIHGRSRRVQLDLVEKFELEGHGCPGGGCLLTDDVFSRKMQDLFDHKEKIETKDILLLKVGRHFRVGENKIIVGRKEEENKFLENAKEKDDSLFLVANDVPGPITLLQGPKSDEVVKLAASLTARYSDADTDEVVVKYDEKEITVSKISDEEIGKIRV